MLPNINTPSPTRRYVVALREHVTKNGAHSFTARLVRFTLPESYENTLHDASWYFYNKKDTSSSGGNAFPAEILETVQDI